VPPNIPRSGSSSRVHLDFLLLNENGRLRAASPMALWLAPPVGRSGGTLGTVENWWRDSTGNDQARLAFIYHGADEVEPTKLRYSAGVMVLSKEHPRTIRYRSAHPILTPDLPVDHRGIVANVVFPTVSTGETILAYRIDSICAMGWQTIGSGWLALRCRIFSYLKDSPTRPSKGIE
jgi:hypothetical protein